MNTKRIPLIFSLAAVIALFAATAFAPQAALAASGGGTGTLTASGNGLAWIRGNGAITMSGNGLLEIRDFAGDASIQVTGDGRKVVKPNGRILYFGFHGTALVSGTDVRVSLSGYDIHLEATGTGQFVLRGNGTYDVDGTSGVWTRRPVIHTLP